MFKHTTYHTRGEYANNYTTDTVMYICNRCSSKEKNMELLMTNKPTERAVVAPIAWYLELPVQSVPITTKVVSSNPAHVDTIHRRNGF